MNVPNDDEDLSGASTEPLMPNMTQVSLVGDQLRLVIYLLGKVLYRQTKPDFRVLGDEELRVLDVMRDDIRGMIASMMPLGDDGGNGGGGE